MEMSRKFRAAIARFKRAIDTLLIIFKYLRRKRVDGRAKPDLDEAGKEPNPYLH